MRPHFETTLQSDGIFYQYDPESSAVDGRGLGSPQYAAGVFNICPVYNDGFETLAGDLADRLVHGGAMVDANFQGAEHPAQDANRLFVGTQQQRLQFHVSNHSGIGFGAPFPASPGRIMPLTMTMMKRLRVRLIGSPDRKETVDPQNWAIAINSPRSHSKCMRFRGQLHGLVFRLLWSSLAPGTFPRRRPYQSYRLGDSGSVGVSIALSLAGIGRVPVGPD